MPPETKNKEKITKLTRNIVSDGITKWKTGKNITLEYPQRVKI